jgi:hypothetical protein
MSDKKNIDRLFQEKFKDFEVPPSNSVWNNISTELQNNRKGKKAIPVWWRIAGIAAALLLLFTLSKFMQNNNAKTTTPLNETIVDVDPNTDNDLQDVINKENIVSEDFKPLNSSLTNPITTPARNDNSTTKSEDNIATVIAENTTSELIQEKTDTVLNNDNDSKETTVPMVTAFTNTNDNVGDEDAIEAEEINPIIEEEKLSLTEEIAAIEEGNIEDDDEKFERWSASSNIAPVYFNTLGKGSSIHPQFNSNSKTGNINMSYGISGSYAINKKLSVRAGVNKVNLGYSTNDVVVFINANSPSNPQLLRNVQFNETGENISFISVEVFNFAQVPGILNDFIKSSIDQKLGFIEIPLELEYRISNKKMGINIISGFSALFLSDNEIYSVLDGNSTLLGKATNINNTSFSANFGLGFDFKISDKFNLNLEPVFKYQLNTFNNTSGNFKPYFIGVYSGLSFKF